MAKAAIWMSRIVFFCPGCEEHHQIDRSWQFNDNLDLPTISPSILIDYTIADKRVVCHCYVKEGRTQFLDDCTHKLRGQTVDLSEVDWGPGDPLP